MSNSKYYGLPSLTVSQCLKMVDASEDLASQKTCFWCYEEKQGARYHDHQKYLKLTMLAQKQKKSDRDIKMHLKSLPKDLKLNPPVPSPRFIYSTAEGKRRAGKMAIKEKAQHCRRKEIKAHTFNSLCTIQEAEEEEDESATGTNLFYNVHICAHAFARARPISSGSRNEAIYRLAKMCDFETLQYPEADIAGLESKLENLGYL